MLGSRLYESRRATRRVGSELNPSRKENSRKVFFAAANLLLQTAMQTSNGKPLTDESIYLQSTITYWKERPQPQDLTAFGLSNVKP